MKYIILALLPSLVASSCFTRFEGKSLVAKPIATINNVNLEKCFHLCLEISEERCRGITFVARKGMCQLHSSTKETTRLVSNPMADFFHRTCFKSINLHRLRDTAAIDSGCFTVTKGKVLIGLVDQLLQGVESVEACQKACSTSMDKFDIACKSAMFYEKEKECILATQSKNDIPDLYIDDEKSVYIENTCAGKDDKIAAEPSEVFKDSSKFIEPANKTEAAGAEVVETTPAAEGEDVEVGGKLDETTTLATLLHKATTLDFSTDAKDVKLEASGYDSPSDAVHGEEEEDEITTTMTTTTTTTTTTTPKPTTTINAKIVDTYNVVAEPKSDYGRRLKDVRIRPCFREVRPLIKMTSSRVVRSYSLEQCTDMCRLCKDCLKGEKCKAVGFDISRELCALSSSLIADGGKHNDNIIYHNRMNC